MHKILSVGLVLLLCPFAQAESRGAKWLRRSLGIAACGLSAWDGVLSAHYLDGRHGVREGNGLLANPDGTLMVGRMAGLKAVGCVVPFIAGEVALQDRYQFAATAFSSVQIGVYGYQVGHDYQVLGQR